MINQLYSVLQQSFSLLQKHSLPQQKDDFNAFCNWLNQQGSHLQYVELAEYYDNGLEQCLLLQQHDVDIDALQNKIDVDIATVLSSQDQVLEQDQQERYIDLCDTAFDSLFDNIKAVADPIGLKLLVVMREHPYWMVVPNRDEQVQKLIQAFNYVFAKDKMFLVEH